MTLCASCSKANVSCPVYPLDTQSCVAYSYQKPLFIPLKTEYYEAFVDGSKTEELRRYGPGWNETTCKVGRAVVLSKGYGKQARVSGRIYRFKKKHGSLFGSTYQAAIKAVYGTLDIEIACIGVSNIGALQT